MISRTLTPFLSLIIAVILFFFVIQPQYTEIVSIRNSAKEYVEATEKYQNFTETLDKKIIQKLDRPALDNERLDTFVPNVIEPAQLLVDLEALAGNHNMLFGNMSVDEGDSNFSDSPQAEVSSDLATADISFDVLGTYPQFKAFMSDIERSLNLFEVTRINFTVSEDSVFVQYKVTVRTYALPKS